MKTIKQCLTCRFFVAEKGISDFDTCAHPAVNEKHPAFLVRGTRRECLIERAEPKGPCGTEAKLHEPADVATVKERKRKYFRPEAE